VRVCAKKIERKRESEPKKERGKERQSVYVQTAVGGRDGLQALAEFRCVCELAGRGLEAYAQWLPPTRLDIDGDVHAVLICCSLSLRS